MNITYNTFTKMVVNSVNQVIDNSSNSVSRLKDIENKLYRDLFGNKWKKGMRWFKKNIFILLIFLWIIFLRFNILFIDFEQVKYEWKIS